MRPRVAGFIVALAVLVLLLFLANYISVVPQQQKQNMHSGDRTGSFTWLFQLKRSLGELVGFDLEQEEEYEHFQPAEQGNLNYQKRNANSINSFVSVTVSPIEGNNLDNNDRIQHRNNNTGSTVSNHQTISQPYLVLNNEQLHTVLSESDGRGDLKQQTDLLSTYRMNREAIGRQQQRVNDDNEAKLNAKCQNNKYDRLIAQDISMNSISRPVVKSDGRFDNPFPTWTEQSFANVLKFLVWEPNESSVPKSKDELDKALGPMIKPDFSDLLRKHDDSEFSATWIGHATVLIQVDGYNILTDPIFSERASFTQLVGPKRIRSAACDIKSLPPIDIVLISHNHYDHLDTNSVRELNDRFGRECRWIVPLGLGAFLRSMSVQNYVELDWWQKDCYLVDNVRSHPKQAKVSLNDINNNTNSFKVQARSISAATPSVNTNQITMDNENINDNEKLLAQRPELNIYLTPSQHWSRRGINDVNKSLWGSYTIVNKNGSTFFFGGDTGYCSAFEEIGKIFGPFTGAAIPIGAYKPRWFLKAMHVDPEEAVRIHKDLRCMKSIAIHYATFILSNERFDEPANLLKEIMDKLKVNGTNKEPFITLKHGETTQFCKTC